MMIEPDTQTPPEPQDTEAEIAASMAEGIAVATPAPVEPVVEAAAKPDADPAATPIAAPVATDPAKVVDPITPPVDAETEKEIIELGLKEKATARFRELTGVAKDYAPIKDALDKAGFKAEQMPQIMQSAKDHSEWVGMVADTGATPEQYGESLDVLRFVTQARGGDHAAAESALQILAPICAEIAKLTGREVPGVFDPLEAHADLKDAVDNGDMERKFALETAALRSQNVSRQRADTTRNEQTQSVQATETGRVALNTLGAELSAADPAGYAAKAPYLIAMVQEIKASRPPAQWADATRRAYANLPAPAVAPVATPLPAIGHVPLRPTGSRPNVTQSAFDDPEEAMRAGIAAASR
jgi:hypothetical protein